MSPPVKLNKRQLIDRQAVRVIVHTHPLKCQSDERPEDFVLRIVHAYDEAKK